MGHRELIRKGNSEDPSKTPKTPCVVMATSLGDLHFYQASQVVHFVVVLVPKSRLTLCNPMDCSLPDSSIHGIIQAKIMEWIAISFSRESSRPGD